MQNELSEGFDGQTWRGSSEGLQEDSMAFMDRMLHSIFDCVSEGKMKFSFLLVLALVWTLGEGLIDTTVGTRIVNQALSADFVKTTASITHSEMTHGITGLGIPVNGVDIQYHYRVAGRSYTGTRFRYNEGATTDSEWAYDALKSHPLQAEADVFYSTSSPGDALLSPGLNGADYMLLLLITPSTMAMLGLWYACVARLLGRFHPIEGAIVAIGGVAAIAILALGIPFGFHPPTSIASGAFIATLGSGIAVFIWKAKPRVASN